MQEQSIKGLFYQVNPSFASGPQIRFACSMRLRTATPAQTSEKKSRERPTAPPPRGRTILRHEAEFEACAKKPMVKQVHLNFLARLVTRVNRPNLASATLPVEPRCRHSPRTRAACLPFIPARDGHVETRRPSEEANTTLAKGRNKAWTARRRNIALRDAQKPCQSRPAILPCASNGIQSPLRLLLGLGPSARASRTMAALHHARRHLSSQMPRPAAVTAGLER